MKAFLIFAFRNKENLRSYLETLIEYNSQTIFNGLQNDWTLFLSQKFKCDKKGFSIFQNQEYSSTLFNLFNSPLQPINKEGSLFSEYRKIIFQVEEYIDFSLKTSLKGEIVNWLIFKAKKKFESSNQNLTFDLESLFKNWCKINKSELPSEVDLNFFKKLKQTESGNTLVSAIEKFYNHNADLFGIRKDEGNDILSLSDIEIKFDQCKHENSDKTRVSLEDAEKNNFISFKDSSCDFLIHRFNKSKISIEAKLFQVKNIPAVLNDWFSIELVQLINESNGIVIGQSQPKIITLNRRIIKSIDIKNLIVSDGAIIEINVEEVFTEEELQLIQKNIHVIFPFYFSKDQILQVKIEKKDIDNTCIRLSSKAKNILAVVSK